MSHRYAWASPLFGLLGLVLAPLASAQPIDLPEIPECTQLTPGAVSVDNTPVTLDLRVLLDGVSQARGQQLVNKAQAAFGPLGITLSASFESVAFSSNLGSGLIAAAKAHYGGARPNGIDIVYVLTSKDITDGGTSGNGLAGLADCIGGVAFGDRAFAVGENIADSPLNLIVYQLGTQMAANTLAHEVGHLLGGHHHYANCIEGMLPLGGATCTLMFNFVDNQKLKFSSLNSLVVRGHTQLFAAP